MPYLSKIFNELLKFHLNLVVGILRYLSKDEIAKLAKGDTSGLTKAVIGSSMLLELTTYDINLTLVKNGMNLKLAKEQ